MPIKDKLDQSRSLIEANSLSDPDGIAFSLRFEGTNRVINITNAEVLQITIDAIDDKKITELDPITGSQLAGDDVLAVVDISEDETKKITADELFVSFLRDGVDELTVGDLHLIDNRIENLNGGIVFLPVAGSTVDIAAANITGGSITGTTIGGSGALASDGTFNNLTVLSTGVFTVAQIDNVSINPTTAAPGRFSTLALTGDLTAPTSNAGFAIINGTTITATENVNAVDFVTSTGKFDGVLGSDGGTNHTAYVTDLTATGTATINTAALTNLFINSGQVNSTADELNLLDGSIAGSIVNGKAVIYSDSGHVNATQVNVGPLGHLTIEENDISTTVGNLALTPIANLVLNPTGQILLQSDTVLTSGTFQAQNFFADNSIRTAGSFFLGTNASPPVNYLEIKTDAQNPIIQSPSATGNLKIQSHELFIQSEDGTQDIATFTGGGQVKLNFNGTTKIQTTSTGSTLSGDVVVATEGSNAGTFQAAGGIISTSLGGTEALSSNASVLNLTVYGNTQLGDAGTDTITVNGITVFNQLVTANNGFNLPSGCINLGPSGSRRLSICYTDSSGGRDSAAISLSQPSDEALKAPLVISTDTLSVITNSGVTADMLKLTYDRASIYQQGREIAFTRSENIIGEGTVDTFQINGNFQTTGDINTQHVDMETGFLSRGPSKIEGNDLQIEEASARIQLIDNSVTTDLKTAYISNAVDGEVMEVGTSLTLEANGAKQSSFVPGAGRIKLKAGGVQLLDFDYIRPSSPLVESNYTQIRNRNADEDLVINPNRNLVVSTPNMIQLDDAPVFSLVDATDRQTVLSTSTRSTWSGEDGNIVLNSDPSGLVDNSVFAVQLGGDDFLRMTEGTNSGSDMSTIVMGVHDQNYFSINRRQSGDPISIITLGPDFPNGNRLIMEARSQVAASYIELGASTVDYMTITEEHGAEEGFAHFSTHVEIPDAKELRFGNVKDVHFRYDDPNNKLELRHDFEKKFEISGASSSAKTLYLEAASFEGGGYQKLYGRTENSGSVVSDTKLVTNDSGVTVSGRALIEEYNYTSIKPSVAFAEIGSPDIKSVLAQDDYSFRIQTEEGSNVTDRFAIYQQDKADLGYTAGIKEFKNGDTHFLAGGTHYRMIWDESEGRLGLGMRWNPTATPPLLEDPAARLHLQESITGVGTGIRIDNSSPSTGRIATGIRFKLGNETNSVENTPKAAIFYRSKEASQSRSYGRGDLHFAINGDDDATEVDVDDVKMMLSDRGFLGVGTAQPDAIIETRGSGAGQGLRIYNSGLPTANTSFIDLQNDNSKMTISHWSNGPLSINETDYNAIDKQRMFLHSGNILLNVAAVSDSVFTTTGSEGNIQIYGESMNNDISNIHILSEILSPAAIRRVMTFETNHAATTTQPKRVAGHIRTGIYDATDVNSNPPLILASDKLIIQSEAGTSEFASFDSAGFEVTRVLLDDGTNALPSLSFQADKDTGLYRVGDNILGVTTGGTQRVEVDGDGVWDFSLGSGSFLNFSFIEDDKTGIAQYSTTTGYRNLQFRASSHEFVTGTLGGTTLSTAFTINADQTSVFSNSASVSYDHVGATTFDVFNSNTDAAASTRLRVGNSATSCLDIYKVGNAADINIDAKETTANMIFHTGGSETFRLLPSGDAVLNNVGGDAFFYIGGSTGSNRLFLGRDVDGNASLTNTTAAAMSFGTDGFDRLHITANGEIGIATSTPATLLHLVGDTVGGDDARIRIQHHATINNFLDLSSENTGGVINYTGGGTDGLEIKTQGDRPLKLFTNNTERVFIDGNGKIAFNKPTTYAEPLVLLDTFLLASDAIPTGSLVQSEDNNVGLGVVNRSAFAQYSGIRFETRTAQASGWLIGNEHQSDFRGDFFFRSRNASSTSVEVMRLTSEGRVGIGLTDPTDLLTIRSQLGSSADINIQTGGPGNPGRVRFGDEANPGTGAISYIQQNQSMTFRTNNVDRATISGTGEVSVVSSLSTPSLTLNGTTRTTWPDTLEYEEGSFTPNIGTTGSSFNYTLQRGHYIRVENVVHIWLQITVSTVVNEGTSGSVIMIDGLPFDVNRNQIDNRMSVFTGGVNYPTNVDSVVAYAANDTDLGIIAQRNDLGWRIMRVGEWTWGDGSAINVFGSYVTT